MALSFVRSVFEKASNALLKNPEVEPLTKVASTAFKALAVESTLISKLSSIESSLALRVQKIVITHNTTQQEEEILIRWLKTIQVSLGEEILTFVSNPASYSSTISLDQIICFLQKLFQIGRNSKEIESLLKQFYLTQISLTDVLIQMNAVREKVESLKQSGREYHEILKAFKLSEKETEQITQEYHTLCQLGGKIQQQGITTWIAYIQKGGHDKLTLLAIVREAIHLKLGIYPYSTQMLTILALLNYPLALKGRIAQVATGEGKSTLTAILAFYNAAQGHVVDIISSSSYLAKRDFNKYREFFQTFGFTSSHICHDLPDAQDFQKQIIFGTNYDFEFSILRDYLQEEQHRMGVRPFQVVIVDEVDNLFIDSALSSARMAIKSRVSFDWIYSPILDFVRNHQEALEKASWEDGLEDIVRELKATLTAISPQALDLPHAKLKIWLQMAYTALYQYKLNEDYVVKTVQENATLTTKTQIVIVDRQNTGRLKETSRWQNGLHEFLEAINNLTVEEESSTAAALSHPVFFNYYNKIYGLTGTIGTEIEQKEVESIYGVDTITVPTHKPKRHTILSPLFFSTKEEHFQALLSEIQHMQASHRPSLVLFESIQESKDFVTFLDKNSLSAQVLNERQPENEDFIVIKAGMPKVSTIATNTAGRGTDIIIHPTSLEKGGLHAIFAFYPQNQRVEDQGFGRAARQGQVGSGRLILHSPLPLNLLEDHRIRQTTLLSVSRLERSSIERIKHTYLENFFKLLKKWEKALDESFLSHCPLSPDQLSLLTKQGHISDEKSFKSFLQEIRSQLRTELLQDWAEYFYTPLEDLYTSLRKDCPDAVSLQKAYQEAIEEQYQTAQIHWKEKFLSPIESCLSDVVRNTF